MLKTVLARSSAPDPHWVGDGFHVRGMFGYSGAGVHDRSPFLMLDHAAPTVFPPIRGHRRGVGAHPHRGFETVTIVYEGEVEHRDSTGAGGVIGPGDVQWMTAGKGIVHEEFHTQGYSERGGPFEMVQLWVNLPARDKLGPAGYQAITAAQIPELPLAQDAGRIRLIAGEFSGVKGPARTHTLMHVWDLRTRAGSRADLPQPEGWTCMVVVLAGQIRLNLSEALTEGNMATLSRGGTGVVIESERDARLLLLAGEPIDEPVVGYGPFVMNTREEIGEAVMAFNRGEFGRVG